MIGPAALTRTASVGKALVAALAGLAIAACAVDRAAPAPGVPEQLAPSAQASLAMIAKARGVQIYRCRQSADRSGTYEWVFVAPEADLFDARGDNIGRHFAGPAWESRDGSRIVGTVQSRSDAPAADAIPWLLLTAKAEGREGAFSKVTQVQRLNTAGGNAPSTGCAASAHGTTVRVPYVADYYFWKPGAVYSSY